MQTKIAKSVKRPIRYCNLPVCNKLEILQVSLSRRCLCPFSKLQNDFFQYSLLEKKILQNAIPQKSIWHDPRHLHPPLGETSSRPSCRKWLSTLGEYRL